MGDSCLRSMRLLLLLVGLGLLPLITECATSRFKRWSASPGCSSCSSSYSYVADLVAILVAILVATLVAILVVTRVATRVVVTQVAPLQGVAEVPQLSLSSQAPGLGPIMEEEAPTEDHMEDHTEGAPTVHTLLGLLVLCVADTQSYVWFVWHYYWDQLLTNHVLDNL